MSKTIIFSHIADLDGVASAVITSYVIQVAKYQFLPPSMSPYNEVTKPTIVLADYHDYLQLVQEHAPNYDRVYILDLSLREPELMNSLSHLSKENIIIVDHHSSSRELLESWKDRATILFDDSGASCTADLLWEYRKDLLKACMYSEDYQALEALKNFTHSRDLWIRDYVEGDLISDVIDELGATRVMNRLLEHPSRCLQINWSDSWLDVLDRAEKARKKALDLGWRSLVRSGDLDGIEIITCLSSGNRSEVGDEILKQYPLAFIVMINLHLGTLSYRTTLEAIAKAGFGVDEIAKRYGGGGHPYAAGSPMSNSTLCGGSQLLNDMMVKDFIQIQNSLS